MPSRLALEPHKLRQLERSLGAFTLHRLLGLFCAVASMPELPPPSVWLGEVMQHVMPADEAQARSIMELLMVVYNQVVSTCEHDDIHGLIPEVADAEACRDWARGYTTLLGRMDPAQMDGDVRARREHHSPRGAQGRPQRPVPLRVRQEVQEVPRNGVM